MVTETRDPSANEIAILREPADARTLPSEGGKGLASRVARLVLGPPLPGRVPVRVTRAIELEQERSEVLVSLIQLGAILTFAILYTLAPKAFPESVPFEPVPVTLGVYALFTLFRLWLAWRRRLQRWFLALSVVVDIAVLMVTIWSFHLQYQAPAAVYLKAPTIMYAFILIALRALRFEPGFVLLAGVTASAGWLALVAYALFVVDTPITRDWAEYMMSYTILLGAEFDKVVSLLMVTLILAIALHRARKVLIRATAEQIAAGELSRFFAPEVAGRIRETDSAIEPGQAELRDAAILMVDLRGFTPLSHSLPPRDVIELLSDYQARMVAAIDGCGGSVDKFMGDGILASFGATRPSTTYARDALRALEAIASGALIWKEERRAKGRAAPPINAAVATGRVMFGAIGDASRLEYTVIGDPVNLVAKLEKHSKVERALALCPVETLELARMQGFVPARELELRADRSVDGLDEPLDLAVLASPM
jgi:adenylate cyclase